MKILIGIQPSGKLTIGNYLGCLAKGLRYQEQGHDVNFMLANYHSLTTDSHSDITEEELKRLGCKKITKQTPEHTEIFLRLCCKMNMGTLLKMPQFKDKREKVDYDLGLLLYPVLMAADIIINDPDVVLVGRDQVPHMELTNDICKRIGVTKKFEYEFGDVEKILSLIDPTQKMSKSLGEKHVMYLFNEDYKTKLAKANMDEEGFKNIKLIGDFFGVVYEGSNQKYKNDIASAMEKKFNS